MYRDFIYLDTDRLQSIIAPLQEGLLDQVIEGKTEEYSGGEGLPQTSCPYSFLSALLLLQATRTRLILQNKVLHDYAFNVALESLRDQGFLLENDLDSMTETGFVLLEGPVRIFDYETFSKIAETFDKLDEFFNSNLSKNELKKRRESPEHRRFVSPKF